MTRPLAPHHPLSQGRDLHHPPAGAGCAPPGRAGARARSGPGRDAPRRSARRLLRAQAPGADRRGGAADRPLGPGLWPGGSEPFPDAGIPTLNGAAGIAASRNKMRALQLLAAGGVPVPPTVMAANASDLKALVDLVGGLPVLIKLLTPSERPLVMVC